MSTERPEFSICKYSPPGAQFVCDAKLCTGNNFSCKYKEGKSPIPTGHPEEKPKESNILTEALAIIYGDREKTYGSPDKNLQTIADLWTTYCNTKSYPNLGFKFDVNDVCYMMVLLKVARLANDPQHHDSRVDGCGYFALAERVQQFHRNTTTKDKT